MYLLVTCFKCKNDAFQLVCESKGFAVVEVVGGSLLNKGTKVNIEELADSLVGRDEEVCRSFSIKKAVDTKDRV